MRPCLVQAVVLRLSILGDDSRDAHVVVASLWIRFSRLKTQPRELGHFLAELTMTARIRDEPDTKIGDPKAWLGAFLLGRQLASGRLQPIGRTTECVEHWVNRQAGNEKRLLVRFNPLLSGQVILLLMVGVRSMSEASRLPQGAGRHE